MSVPELFAEQDKTKVANLTSKNFVESATGMEILRYNDSSLYKICEKLKEDDTGDTYCFINLDTIVNQIKRWFNMFPRVQPYYAIKCFPDPGILKFMASTGVMGYDCASGGEIQKMASLLDDTSRIIFANPIKNVKDLTFARDHGVYFMTLDNVFEFSKIIQVYNERRAQILVRIAVDGSYSLCNLSSKFGATIDEAKEIIIKSKDLNVDLVGVSFHVGSGCMSQVAFHSALNQAHQVFQFAKSHDIIFKYLDIGGGFPGIENKIKCDDMATVINEDLDILFPGITVISEPGRYFAEKSSIICCIVTKVSKNTDKSSDLNYVFRLNEGTLGVFRERITSGIDLYPIVLISNNINGPKFKTRLLGNTNSKTDIVWPCVDFPLLSVGDWIGFHDHGAYSISVSSVKYQHQIIYLAKEYSE